MGILKPEKIKWTTFSKWLGKKWIKDEQKCDVQ